MDLRRLGLYIEDLEQALKLEDINAELELATQEQRDLDQEAETAAPSEEDRGAGRAKTTQAPAPDLTLTPATPDTQAEDERRAKEAKAAEEKAKKEADEAEAKAQKERERKEIEDRSKGAAEDFELGQDAEKNLTGQKDIFAQPPELQISSEKEKEQALKLFSSKLALVTRPFLAKFASRSSRISPKLLNSKQQALLKELAGEAVDLGMPASVLNLVSSAGSTGIGSIAAMTESGSLLLGKGWANVTRSEQLSVIIHEIGHAVDAQIGPRLAKGKQFSATPEWSTAHDELKAWYNSSPIKHPLGYPFAPQFAGKVRMKAESFAQAYDLYFTNPVKLQTNAPQSYSQIQSIVEGIQNESKAASAAGAAKTNPSRVDVQQARAEKDSGVQPRAGEVGTGVGKAARGKDRDAEQVNGVAEKITPEPVKFYEDIPNESWLQGKIDDASTSPRSRFGVPRMLSTTGSFSDPVLVPARFFEGVRGSRGEQDNVRQDSLSAIRKIIRETGRMPLMDDGREYVPYVEIGYDGKPFISEGNHRVMAAIAEGMKYIPVQLRYFDGGQRRAGRWSPDNLKEITDRVNAEMADRVSQQEDVGNAIKVDGKERPTRNADGRLIENTPEKLRNFWRFFGDSKVVDEQGEPIVVYHGTMLRESPKAPGMGDIKAFDRLFSTKVRAPSIDTVGSWFSTNAGEGGAEMYSGKGAGSAIYPAYLSIKNPHQTTFRMMMRRARMLANGKDDGRQIGAPEVEAYRKWLKSMDKDGIHLVDDPDSDSTEFRNQEAWIALEPEQIKSATGNIGTYGDVQEINMMQSPIADPDAIKGEGKKAVDNSRESILYQPVDGTWNTPMDPKPLKLSDEFFYNWVDKQVDLKRVVDAIKETGKRVAGKFNALERERTYHGRVAKRTQDYMTNELQPTIELMKKYGITQREMGEYLLNRHAPEANKVIAERNPRFPDAGSSVKTEDAIKYMQNLDPLRKRQLDAVATRMDKTLTKMQDMLVKYGIETQDTIDGWRDMFQYYIPLVRDDTDYSINKVMSQGAGYSRSGDTAKSRTGSAKEVNLDEIFSNIAMQHERMIVRAEGNRVGQAVFGLALTQPNPGFWLALDPETNVIWKTIKELEDIKADRDLIKEMLDSGELSPSQEAEYRMELDLIRKIIKKKEQPARSAFAKARDDVMELGFNPEEATKLVEQLMMPPMKARYNKDKNEVVYEPNAAVNNEFVFATRVNGSDKFVLFNGNDERANRMARALKNMDAENLSEAMNIAAKITRFFAAINTQYNPVFGAYNFLRDLQTAALQISTTDIADKRKDVINGTPAALKAIFQVARARRDGKKVTGELAKDFEEFENEGGQTGFRDQFSQSAERAEAIQRMIDPSSWASSPLGKFFTAGGKLKVPMETMRKGAAPLFDFLSDYNQALENSVRLSAYRVARDKFISEGMSPADAKQKAAVTAKEITVNFNQKGVKATQIGALYAFFNASVQGTTMMARTLAGPLGRKIIAGGMLWGVIQTIMLAMAGFDDEEPPEFVKQRNFIIPYGLIIPGAEGKYLAFPMPLGFNVIPTLSRLATEAVISGGENTSGKALSALDAVMDMFNPIGNAGLSFQTLAPTLLDPLVALSENKSWTGQSIAREDFSALNPTPGFTRSRDSANAISQEVARLLNSMSGGSEDRKGIISPTADQLEYLVGQLTGGVGRELLKAGKTVESAVTGEELPSYSVPLVGRFFGDVNEMAAVSSAFYRNLTELNIQKEEIKTIRQNKGDLKAYLAENPEARLSQMATAQYTQIKNLRKLRQEALEKGNKERAKKIEEAIKARMINLNERYDKLTD
jgi:hypothetical protein